MSVSAAYMRLEASRYLMQDISGHDGRRSRCLFWMISTNITIALPTAQAHVNSILVELSLLSCVMPLNVQGRLC
ncbi:uncharacterized protein ARMOST_12237 [Armillaria ostoyae]|uniref:Uncharacterized protein n=1 Tax=Armillaria ostoyae TaxID=47428 RepID=A0A284RJF8_ARMOS|nr:uncharacterized protein ARMOST_12237 [Armillaria ostoyae]